MTAKTIRCAIYTRKSSDEGLDQSFNSLDAQREAGEAYVKSQASEGWSVIPSHYDDGGFSGGTMERPGLQRLLADIEAGLVDVVVVYKIDRLTRSLSDFSRIVEVFEKAGASFVSVTQSFNTTNSMGRLMLNVLLSFAQFEREVTGERIRDKIAASKAKGMWMGGTLALGYDLPATGTRTLQVNESEAATVRQIFVRYLDLGSVHALQRELADEGIRPKQRVTANSRSLGGEAFSRGALFHLLRNRIYLGQIVHRDAVHQGEHKAIVDDELFDRVQQMLDGNARRHHVAADHRIAKAPLTGKLFDVAGEPMSPTFSRGKSGRSYRYYVSASLQQGAASHGDGVIRRLSAQAIERVITEVAERVLATGERAVDHVMAVRLVTDGLIIDLPGGRVADLALPLSAEEKIVHADAKVVRIYVPLAFPLRGGRPMVRSGATRSAKPDATLIAALRKAHRMLEREGGMPVIQNSPQSLYDRRILRLAFLAPVLQRDILAGRQPPMLSLEKLKSIDIPLAWNEQKAALGWPN
jgi:DNA invertase Pin-like site-specific DNA recombinase